MMIEFCLILRWLIKEYLEWPIKLKVQIIWSLILVINTLKEIMILSSVDNMMFRSNAKAVLILVKRMNFLQSLKKCLKLNLMLDHLINQGKTAFLTDSKAISQKLKNILLA